MPEYKLLDISNPEADIKGISLFLLNSYKVNFFLLVFQFTALTVTVILSSVFEVKWKNIVMEH